MNGINCVAISGDVCKTFYNETTIKADPVTTLIICVQENQVDQTWVKCVSYGDTARYLQDRVRKGDRVEIVGKLVNERNRATDKLTLVVKTVGPVVVIPKNRFNQNGGEHGEGRDYQKRY